MLDVDVKGLLGGGMKLAERFGDEAYYVALCIRSGLVRPELPHRVAQMLVAFERYGLLAGAVTIGAIRHGDRVAIHDERGDLSYKELDERSNALANAWRDHGLEPGEGVAILVRNHRGFLDAVFAAAKCGARIVLLNTSFAGPQIREVAEREGTDLLVYDDEYSDTLKGIDDPSHGRWRAWVDDPEAEADDTLDALIAKGSTKPPPKPGESPKIVILTSGTTGTPKGAPRSEPKSLSLIGGLLGKVPFKAREVTEMCVPMFHALGFALTALSLAMGSNLVIRRRFDPETTLDSLEENKATAMIVVPVMLQRILDLGEDKIKARDTSSLRIIFVGGSAFGAELCKRALNAFGPVVYNLYGSTEVSYATIATPQELQEEPGTVGGVVRGSIVKILDEDGNEAEAGTSGRIFVGNAGQFEGYTGGETKEQIGGLMSSGDVGHFDDKGRLFIDGRDDDMIVSGGENVFPGEIEELLSGHEAVEEVAAIGVDDEKFGQRLKAFVVLRDGKELSEDDAKAYVKENLANYKVPREIVFIDELPRNPTGKVLKRELEDGDGPEADSSESEGAEANAGDGDGPAKSQGASTKAANGKTSQAKAKGSDGKRAQAKAKDTDGKTGSEATSEAPVEPAAAAAGDEE
ncbi:MAG: fatty-acyl-CoA synthase [Actinomycetota bacterium]|jgi:fatty-acyl-CoA synthase|nr:fatty-acyl-CoA synthase [Actinomycetota bacterium]